LIKPKLNKSINQIINLLGICHRL